MLISQKNSLVFLLPQHRKFLMMLCCAITCMISSSCLSCVKALAKFNHLLTSDHSFINWRAYRDNRALVECSKKTYEELSVDNYLERLALLNLYIRAWLMDTPHHDIVRPWIEFNNKLQEGFQVKSSGQYLALYIMARFGDGGNHTPLPFH